MRIVARLALLLVLVPVVELLILIRIGRAIGVLPTVGIVLATALAGALLARAEGMRVLLRLQQELAHGRLPGPAVLDGVSVLLGGTLLLAPGVLTDLLGLSLLFPPTRRLIHEWALRRLERALRGGAFRVVSMGGAGAGGFGAYAGGFGSPRGPGVAGWPGAGRGPGGRAGDPARSPRPDGLDPSREIVIEPDEHPRG